MARTLCLVFSLVLVGLAAAPAGAVTLYSPILQGRSFICEVSNLGTTPVTTGISFVHPDGTAASPDVLPAGPGATNYLELVGGSLAAYRCVATFSGSKNKVRAVFHTLDTTGEIRTSVELR
jgi:hypothetical protein